MASRDELPILQRLQIACDHWPGDHLGAWKLPGDVCIKLIQCEFIGPEQIAERSPESKMLLDELAEWACDSCFHRFTAGHSTASLRSRSASTLVYRNVVSMLRCPRRSAISFMGVPFSMRRVANAWRMG